MAQKTKKVRSAGRFGPRYGLRVRRRIAEIESRQRADHMCPRCNTGKLKRVSTGIWECRKCAHKFAGGAYTPSSGSSKSVQLRPETVDVSAEIPEDLIEGSTEE